MEQQRVNGMFKIPSENMKKFEEEIAKLSKKAVKLVGEQIVLVPLGYTMRENANGTVTKLYDVLIDGAVPVLNGWKFIAKIDHANKELGNVVRAIPGVEVDPVYRHVGSNCDHCNTNRVRRDTYLVRNEESGEVKQVGATCIKDFIGGNNPESVAKLAELLSYAKEQGEYWSQSNLMADRRFISLETYLSFVAMVYRQHGQFVTKTKSRETGQASTADISHSAFYNCVVYNQTDYRLPVDFDLAKVAIEWAQELDGDGAEISDYLHNINVIAKSGIIETRSIGYASSIISSYLRSKQQPSGPTQQSEWVGEVGKMADFPEVVVVNVRSGRSFMGDFVITTFRTPEGNQLYAYGEYGDLGTVLNLRAKVKAHDTMLGKRRTALHYVKVK